jgi:hypothetical protein
MDTSTDLDALDRALARAAERHGTPPLDPRRLRRRRQRLAVGPFAWLLFVVALATAAAVERSWWLAGGLAVVLVPGAVANIVARRREIAALSDAGDFAEYERQYFAAQVKHHRSAVVIETALALLFAFLAWQTGEAWRWLVPGVFAALAAARAVAVLPYVERVNRDTGGAPPPGWTGLLLLFVLFLLLPLLFAISLVRGAWTGLTGRRGGRR